MECLVTKLKSAVSNENLPVFGKIRLWVPTNETLSSVIYFRLGANSDGPVKIESIPSGFRLYTSNNVEITSFPYSLDAGTYLSFRYTNTNTTNPVVLSGIENISFAGFFGGSGKYFTIVPEEFYQIRNMTGCEIQNVKDRNGGPLKLSVDYLQKVIDPANFTANLYAYLTGNLDELPANFFDNAGVESRDLNIGQGSTEVTGNLTRFSKIKARKIYITSIGLSGDIKDIKLDSICTALIWNYTSTNISGDILSFVLTSLIPTGVQSGLEVGSIGRNGTIKFNNNNSFTINSPKLYWNSDGTKVFLRSGDGKTIICYGYDDSEITSLRSSDPLWTTATTVTSVGTTPAI